MKPALILFFSTCLSLTSICKAQSNFSDDIKESLNLYNYSAYFLAKDELENAIAQNNNSSNYLLLGEAHQLLAMCNYSIGFNSQYNSNIEKMYAHKKQLDKPIYYVEYAAYKLRYYTLNHDYTSAFALLDSAKSVLSQNLIQAYLIDTLFFKVNELNCYRNLKPDSLSNSEFDLWKWNLFKEYEKIDWQQERDPFKKATYYMYLGNFLQDFVYYRESRYPKEISDIAKKKAINYYQGGIDLISDELGFETQFSQNLKANILLQYGKNDPSIETCINGYRNLVEELSINIDSIRFFRSVSLPLYASKIYSNFSLNFEQTEEYNNAVSVLKSTQLYRRYFKRNSLITNSREFFEANPMEPNDELVRLFIEDLKHQRSYKDSLGVLDKIWEIQSIRFGSAEYFESISNYIGEESFYKWNNELDSIQFSIQLTLDSLYLSSKGIIKSNTRFEHIIMNQHKRLNSYMVDKPKEFVKYELGKSQQSIYEIEKKLGPNQAQLLYINNPRIVLKSPSESFVLLIQKDKSNLIENAAYSAKKLIPLIRRESDMAINEKQNQYIGYESFMKTVEPGLRSINQIRVINNPTWSSLSFDSFSEDTNYTSFNDAKWLVKKYAFTYSINPSVDYLNGSNDFSQKENILFNSNCTNESGLSIPFITQLGQKMMQHYDIKNNHLKDLNPYQFKSIHIYSHGDVNRKFFEHHPHYKNASNRHKNFLYNCDDRISLSKMDSLNVAGKLVVLANCNSGNGYTNIHSNKYDFVQVFKKNGSQTIVSANKEIDDQSTSIILESFYDYLEDGLIASVALQKAKLKFLSKIEDPSQFQEVYWANLMVNGIDQSMDLYKKKTYWYYMIGLVILIGLLFFFKIRGSYSSR